MFDVDAEFLGQVSEDGEDDAGRDDRRDEVQRGHDRSVDVDLKTGSESFEFVSRNLSNVPNFPPISPPHVSCFEIKAKSHYETDFK